MKLRLGVIFGGESVEHEVSIISAVQAMKNLDEENTKFGEYIASVCDEVILIGDKQTKAIQKGLENKNYDKEHIHILEDVIDAFPLINKLKEKDTYVLLENDLPDLFK